MEQNKQQYIAIVLGVSKVTLPKKVVDVIGGHHLVTLDLTMKVISKII